MNISERGEISMKASKIMATMLLSALLFTGCGIKDQNAIIKINDKAITQGEFDKLMDQKPCSKSVWQT